MITKRECIAVLASTIFLTLLGVGLSMLAGEDSWVSEFDRNRTLSAEVDEHPLLKKYR